MQTPDITESSRVLALVAVEAAEEPDAIARHPEVFEVLDELMEWSEIDGLFERVIPGSIPDAVGYLRSVSESLRPFATAPLSDAPEVVEQLALVSWVVQTAASLESVSQFAALALAS